MISKKKHDRVVRMSRMRNDVIKKKPKEYHPRRWIFALGALFFVSSVLYVLFFSHLVDVVSVEVQGTRRIDKNDVSLMVKEFLSGDIVHYVRKSNFFFLQKKQLIEKIRTDQRIENVRIEKHFPDKITVVVEEYDIVPVWCIGDMLGKCYELQNGCILRAIDLSSALVQQNDHFIIVDRAHDSVEDGQCVIAHDDMEKIAYLGKELRYILNVNIMQPYYIDVRGSREVRYTTDESWDILVSLQHDARDTLDMAQLFMKKVTLPIARKDLAYVDLRFAEKIFYKAKDGVEVPEENTGNVQQEENASKDEKRKGRR